MSAVETVEIAPGDAGQRLDRWLKRRFPDVPQSHFQKWLRTGQVRVDGKRAKANLRLEAGQAVRLPPVTAPGKAETRRAPPVVRVSSDQEKDLLARVLHRDDEVIAFNKPAGLAVQGGTGTTRHLDGMLDLLRFGGDRPRLVHRLDRDTAGVLLLARTARAAAHLTAAFRTRDVRKLYWAAVVGVPVTASGSIRLALSKQAGRGGEKMEIDEEEGKWAETLYSVVDKAGKIAAWVAFEPLTGRTHQIRAHAASLGTPIVGDGKYGAAGAFLEGQGIGRGLHLLARTIRFPLPSRRVLSVTAPLPDHMRETWDFLGFDRGEDMGFQPFDQ